MKRMNKLKRLTVSVLILSLLLLPVQAFAQSGTHTVAQGDSMWKIAVRYQIGVSELIAANPQISNPSQIYPGQKINIPSIDDVKVILLLYRDEPFHAEFYFHILCESLISIVLIKSRNKTKNEIKQELERANRCK